MRVVSCYTNESVLSFLVFESEGFVLKNYRKIIIIGLATVLAVVAGYTVYNHLPTVKVSKAIAAGDKYKNDEDYESAIDSYSEAIQIDSHSVKAYSNMAGAFLSIDDFESAKQVLYDGWQNTENSSLMDNYHTVVLNEAVDAMNDQRADMDTALAILSVLKENNTNSDAIMLLGEACFSRWQRYFFL